jgi:hypothetical protein
MADLLVVAAVTLLFVLPGAWLTVSGLFRFRSARRLRGKEPVPPVEATDGPLAIRGPATTLFADEPLPAPLSAGISLAYSYRVVSLPTPDSAVEEGHPIDAGNAAVPFVVGDDDASVLVHPQGAELHLEDEAVERFEGDPPERVAEFLELHGVGLDEEGPVAVAVRALAPGDTVYVTGLAERIVEGAPGDFDGRFVVRRGIRASHHVVADHPGAAAGGATTQAVIRTIFGVALAVPGLLYLSLFGL